MPSLVFVVGTRPEIIKIAPVILETTKRGISFLVIHTGQHYDEEMSDQFFEVLNIKKPEINLEVQSDDTNIQLGEMIKKLGEKFLELSPDFVIAVGDTISVLASCLASVQANIPFVHVESGLRSLDNTMPEEINRKIVDSVSSLLFSPSQRATTNLMYEGIDPNRVFFVGNTIVDSIRIFSDVLEKNRSTIAQEILESIEGDYIICTIHRVSNTEDKEKLEEIVNALNKIDDLTIIFLLHPRTKKKLLEFNLMDQFKKIPNLRINSSIDYLSMLKIMKDDRCRLILTDSGGLQEEAATLKIPCLTLRPNTERPETVEQGINKLVKVDSKEILQAVHEALTQENLQEKFDDFIFPYGDGYASEKILDVIKVFWNKAKFKSPEMYETGSRSFTLLKIETEIERTLIEGNLKGKITMVYDEKGNPIPIPKRLERGYIVRVTRT